jgi:hypothetical protein
MSEQISLPEISAEIDRLRNLEYAERQRIFEREALPSIERRVGSTFVYRNNRFSIGESWDQFRMLISVRKEEYHHRTVFLEHFIDSEGRAVVQHAFGYVNVSNTSLEDAGWAPCEKGEYESTYRQVLEALGIYKQVQP